MRHQYDVNIKSRREFTKASIKIFKLGRKKKDSLFII